jgi:hypothetical protein
MKNNPNMEITVIKMSVVPQIKHSGSSYQHTLSQFSSFLEERISSSELSCSHTHINLSKAWLSLHIQVVRHLPLVIRSWGQTASGNITNNFSPTVTVQSNSHKHQSTFQTYAQNCQFSSHKQ